MEEFPKSVGPRRKDNGIISIEYHIDVLLFVAAVVIILEDGVDVLIVRHL